MATQPSDPTAFRREGWARAVVAQLFPTYQKQHSTRYTTDVQFIYDWESSVRGTATDPLHMGAANSHSAELSAVAFIKAHKPLDRALSKGDYGAAKKALPSDLPITKSALPANIDPHTGDLTSNNVPSLLDELGGTITGMPAQAGKDAGSLGSLLGNHMVLVVLVVALILVLKK